MGKFTYKDGLVKVNGVDLSDHIKKVDIKLSAASQDATGLNFGGGTETLQGLKKETWDLTFMSDFEAGSVDATLFPLYESGDEFVISATPSAGAVSASNPNWVATVRLMNYDPINAQIGALSTTDVTFEVQGLTERETT